VVNRERISLFLLIFSTAIYVRDAGVAGSNPATPTILPKVDVFQRLGGPAAGASGAPFCNDFQGGSTADLARAGTSVRVAWLPRPVRLGHADCDRPRAGRAIVQVGASHSPAALALRLLSQDQTQALAEGLFQVEANNDRSVPFRLHWRASA